MDDFKKSRLQRLESVLSLVLEIDKAQSENSDIDALMGIIHERLHAIMDATNFFVAICDRERSYFQIPYFKDSFDTRRVHKDDRFPIERNNGLLTVDVLLTGQPMVLDRPAIAERDRLRGKAEVSERLAEHWIGIPLFDSFQTLMGAMVTQSYDPDRGYSEEDIALLTMIASLLAAALERAQRRNALELAVAQRTRQLEEEVVERRKAEQVQRALFEIASTNIDPQNPDKHYAELHRIVAGLLPAPNFYVDFYDWSSDEVYVGFSAYQKDAALPRSWKLNKGLLNLVLKSGRAWLIDQKLTHALIESGEIDEVVGDTTYVSGSSGESVGRS
jgi:transcriptional regulator with GAF, ATPase, and Fis domain